MNYTNNKKELIFHYRKALAQERLEYELAKINYDERYQGVLMVSIESERKKILEKIALAKMALMKYDILELEASIERISKELEGL